MKKVFLTGLAIVLTLGLGFTGAEFETNWPTWRGPEANGVAHNANPPTDWSEEKNVRWKVEIPGLGLATPIIWGDRIFILTAVETDQAVEMESKPQRSRGKMPDRVLQFTTLAISRKDGSTLWKKVSRVAAPHEGTHGTASWASNSGVTDGQHFYAYFGSHGIYCYDLDGNLKWEKDLGDMRTRNGFGEGSSPLLYEDKVIINWDHEDESFIAALDKSTGEQIWKVDRDEPTSWTTPIVVQSEGKPQVIVSGYNRVRSYDPADGKLIWECAGMTLNVVPTPLFHNGLVYVASGFRGNALMAIRLAGASGDITGTSSVVWKYEKDTPYVPSPVLYKDQIYFLKTNTEIVSCLDAANGTEIYGKERLTDIQGIYASPVAAADRIYFVGRSGTSVVLAYGSEYKVLAVNKLDDQFDASPAIAGDELFLRGHKYLYCLAVK